MSRLEQALLYVLRQDPEKVERVLNGMKRGRMGMNSEEKDEVVIKYYPRTKHKLLEMWRRNGKMHREGGPASTNWYKDGQVHFKRWYKDGKMHRDDGPAWLEWDKDGQIRFEIWYRDGKMHRDDGPAWLEWDKDGQKTREIWHRDGKELDKEEIAKIKERILRERLEEVLPQTVDVEPYHKTIRDFLW